MIIRRRVGDLKHDPSPSFELIEAPISKWARQIKRLRRLVFPRWFASDWLPALFRYRGWIIVARLDGRTVGFALCDFFEGETGVYLEEVAVLAIKPLRAFGQLERPVNQRAFGGDMGIDSEASPAHLTLLTKNRPHRHQLAGRAL